MSSVALRRYFDSLLLPILTSFRNTQITLVGTDDLVPFTPALYDILTHAEQTANKNQPNGYAGVDGTGHIPLSIMPSALTGGLSFLGGWNASSNTPDLTQPGSVAGAYYVVTTPGTTPITTRVGVVTTWSNGDLIIWDGNDWGKIDGSPTQVVSILGQIGAITLSQLTAGGVAAANNPILTGVTLADIPSAKLLGTGSDGLITPVSLSGLTVSGGTLAPTPLPALTIMANSGTVVGVATGVPLGTGLSFINNTLVAQQFWTAANITSLSTAFAAPSGVLSLASATLAGLALASSAEQVANKNQPGGYAGVDGSGKIPSALIPAAVAGGMIFAGTWNASTNTPDLTVPSTTSGTYYVVSVAGITSITTRSGAIASWTAGDIILSDGTDWNKIDGSPTEVSSVLGLVGSINLSMLIAGGLAPTANPILSGVTIADLFSAPILGTDATGKLRTIVLNGLAETSGTLGLAPLGSLTIMGNAGIVSAPPVGLPIGGNLQFIGGSLVAVDNFNGGSVAALDASYLNINSGTLSLSSAAKLAIAGAEQTTNKNQPSGYAGLDGSGKLFTSQLPSGIGGGGLTIIGSWNASTNTPNLTGAPPTTPGSSYVVSVAGVTSITTRIGAITEWTPGDILMSDGTFWNKIDGAANEVYTVAGMTGNVTLSASNILGLNGIASQSVPATGLVFSTGTVLSAVTQGSNISFSLGTLSVTGFNSIATQTAPPLGLVYSTGTTLSQVTLLSGVTFNNGTIDVEPSLRIKTLPFSFIGTLAGGQPYGYLLTQAGTLLANGGSFVSYIPVNPVAPQTLLVTTMHAGTLTTRGTIAISTAGVVTPPTFAALAIASGDGVFLINQATADVTFANPSFSLQLQTT